AAPADRRPQVLVNASAVGIYGDRGDESLDEQAAMGGGFLAELCADWEFTAQQAQAYGVRTVLLRLGGVLEKDGGMLAKLLTPFQLGLGGPIGHGHQWLSWIDRDDLINLIFHIMDNPSIQGPINATAPYPVSNQEFAQTLARLLDRPCLLRTPAFVLRAIFGDMANEIMLEGQKVRPKKALESGFIFSYPRLQQSLEKILQRENPANFRH
ncbi:MAG: TIGR01777 family oxidoreductase, partial [Gammaproteobacteria bacterium]